MAELYSPDDILDWFWEIIEQARGDWDKLTSILEGFSKEEIKRFETEFARAVYLLGDDDFIAYMGDASEDTILTISEWIVSQGKAFYLDIMKNPHKTPTEVDIDEESNLTGVGHIVHWRRFREDLEI